MFQQTLTFYVQRPGSDTLDEITFRAADGPTLVDSSNVRKNNPTVTLSQVVGVLLKDEPDEEFDPAAFVQAIPSNRRGAVVRYVIEAFERAKAERARLTAAYPDNDQPRKESP